MSDNPALRPCGSWTSGLDAEMVAAASVRLAEPLRRGHRTWWLEGRPSEGGRSVLVCRIDGEPGRDLVPDPFSVRSRIHEYGGGAWTVDGERAWFVNNSDQSVYVVEPAGIRRICGFPDTSFADLHRDTQRDRLIAVAEHSAAGGEPTASLVAISDDGDCRELVSGADFYASPAISPDGRALAWLEWDHPNMPWDGTWLWLAEFDSGGGLAPGKYLAGSRDESVFQPTWSPDGDLYFVSDAREWWNLWRRAGAGVEQVTDFEGEMGLPQWVFGQRTYAFASTGRAVAAVTARGFWQLHSVELAGGFASPLETGLTSIEHVSADAESVVVLGASSTRPPRILRIGPDGAEELARAGDDVLEAGSVSVPTAVRFATSDGGTAHGLYYPPVNPAFRAMTGELPPLLVKCHGGPTGATNPGLDLKIQFWTSRGFAVLDVNYRGSTGYGRSYRRSLYGRWGLADVEDCVAGANHICELGLADPDRLLISGGSAGGFTVLCALAFADIFVAGASYYGIGDLESLFATTHKFESRYDHHLLGSDPAAVRDRSPLWHADRVTCPVIFFQGALDKVVPPDQSRAMHEALAGRGLATAYVEFPDEAHGFRRSASIVRALNAELAFYARVLGFPVAGGAEPLDIRNADSLENRPAGS